MSAQMSRTVHSRGGEDTMNRRIGLTVLALALVLGLALLTGHAVGQQKSLKEQLIGPWTVVSVTREQGDNKTEPFGPNPQGLFMFDPSGHFAIQITQPGRPKFASNNRVAGTTEENKAAVQGTISNFGTYTVNEADHSVSLHIVGSSYPNWDEADVKQFAEISADEMKWTNPTSGQGTGSALVVLRRAK
jgi:hypothetical protein